MFSAICNVSEWMRYRRRLRWQWMADATRLADESIRRANKRRNQRGHWLNL